MRLRAWYLGVALLVLGVAALAVVYPPSPDPDPVDVSFPGSYAEQGVVTVAEPGPYAIWQAGETGSDADRCRITGPDGDAVKVSEPPLTVRWEPEGEDAITVYTELGTFDAPRAGRYGIACAVPADAPGTAFTVTERPGLGLFLSVAVGAAVAVVAGAVILAVTLVRRRRVRAS